MGLRSIIGQCPECCACPAPTIQWDSRSATKSKIGYNAYSGDEVYLRKTRVAHADYFDSYDGYNASPCGLSGCCSYDYLYTTTSVIDWTQIYDYDPLTGTEVITGPSPTDVTGDSTVRNKISSTGGECIGAAEGITCGRNDQDTSTTYNYTGPIILSCGTYTDVVSGGGTILTRSANFDPADVTEGPFPYGSTTVCAGFYYGHTHTANCHASEVFTLSVPYTTDALKTNTVASLPDYDDDWDDTAGSISTISLNQKTYSVRESRYRFKFKIPKAGLGTCYRLTWKERFTPVTGEPVDTERCIIWDGEIPDDYDPDDFDTWPIIGDGTNPYFELAIPSSYGATNIVDITVRCYGCDEECPE